MKCNAAKNKADFITPYSKEDYMIEKPAEVTQPTSKPAASSRVVADEKAEGLTVILTRIEKDLAEIKTESKKDKPFNLLPLLAALGGAIIVAVAGYLNQGKQISGQLAIQREAQTQADKRRFHERKMELYIDYISTTHSAAVEFIDCKGADEIFYVIDKVRNKGNIVRLLASAEIKDALNEIEENIYDIEKSLTKMRASPLSKDQDQKSFICLTKKLQKYISEFSDLAKEELSV